MLEFSHKPVMLEECMEGLNLKDGGIWYDGYYCADATDYEEAETEYWNTH